MSRITRRPRVVPDLLESASYIALDSPSAAQRFLTSAEDTFQRLLEMPGMGRLVQFEEPELAGIRCWAVRGFPNYLIFYRVTDVGIDIIRVIHGARDLPKALAKELD